MLITKGKSLVQMGKHELDETISAYEKVFLDIGAGSGKFIYRLAKENPHAMCIGLETSQDSLLEYARKIKKKPERGGLQNVIYIIGSVEAPPDELHEIADEIFINYPWTNLLKSLVSGDPAILEKLYSLLRIDGNINLICTYDKRYEEKFIKDYDLPELTKEYIQKTMAPDYKKYGFQIISIEKLDSGKMKKSMSEWGKRLAFGRERNVWRIRFLKITSTAS